jgi:hypothetical protein
VRVKVGSSAHTPYKHALLDDMVATSLGAASRIEWLSDNLLIDTCAGNGTSNAWSGTSSPEIICRRAERSQAKPTRVVLIDRDAATVDQLRQKFGLLSNVRIIHGDYQTEYTAGMIGKIYPKANVLLHIDPNHVDDVGLSPWLRRILPDSTLVLVTLGCNANGIKRLPLDERRQWFKNLEHILQLKLPRHDACLVSLMKDASQWAYVFTIPNKWRARYDAVVRSLARRHWAKGVEMNWLSDGATAFWAAAERLFLKVDGSETR